MLNSLASSSSLSSSSRGYGGVPGTSSMTATTGMEAFNLSGFGSAFGGGSESNANTSTAGSIGGININSIGRSARIAIVGNSAEACLGPFPCVRVAGLPFECSMEEILTFFQGYVVIDILMHRSNEAYILFANAMDFQMALQRDRQTMGARFVEVHPSQRAEYYAAIAEKQWQEKQKENIENQHTIPAQMSAGNNGLQGLEASLDPAQQQHLAQWSLGAAAGMPPQQALTSNHVPGGPTSNSNNNNNNANGSNNAKGQNNNNQKQPRIGGGMRNGRTGGGIQVGDHTGFLRMRGLPFSASKEDIIQFFKGYKIIPDTIVLTYRSDGRATGEGYVGFQHPDDSKAAMVLHRNTIGSRYIELFISNKEEHARAFARFGGR